MIISVSRRTDIPSFYAKWFINRIRAGYCTVPNPFNSKQVSVVSLKPEDVDVIVFWTRNPRPLLPHLDELHQRGYRFYFQFTVLNYLRLIEPKAPGLKTALGSFQSLSEKFGPEKVIWRYDPILFSDITDHQFHLKTYKYIANALNGLTHRSVISIITLYRKTQRRLEQLEKHGIKIDDGDKTGRRFEELMRRLAFTATENGMEIMNCAEEMDLQPYGISPGKCIDDNYIREVFNIDVTNKKDPSQRKACGCAVSKDIGMYDTCLFGCRYCYATSSFERAKTNYLEHNPDSPSLIGWYDAESKHGQQIHLL